MASLSGLYSASPSLKPAKNLSFKALPPQSRDSFSFPHTSNSTKLPLTFSSARSVVRDISHADSKKELLKDPDALWKRYLDWLYQQKELGLYVEVSRVGFTDEFVTDMEPRFQAAFKAMEDLEKGAIANPDEGRMVGHYWLRDSKLAPKPTLKTLILSALSPTT